MAAPYVSITEQTADVYRSLLDDGDAVVLEHHSGIRGSRDSMVARLAAENWDAGSSSPPRCSARASSRTFPRAVASCTDLPDR